MTAGQSRYAKSGWKGKRSKGVLVYNDHLNTWTPATNYHNEIINLSYSNHLGLGMEWQQDHLGGYTSFVKRDNVCYLFTAAKGEAAPYSCVGVKLVNRKKH
jgi:hypothetical protein